ncbi:hypothetical protein SAMN05444266_102207 [Chitinophaga jiangningensis]|uniref:Uncharacterized protein n=1 Tax=Chitinophaga jiangningensis TaxID=1419482 RepID=A0A1M6Y8S3_9BACT|nr:hypothetical protein [Chitinophaga jiangningensis]SHL14694.1 hypothetical protein SAMN05444266_102207 [Chitinophaga jiangningensis]
MLDNTGKLVYQWLVQIDANTGQPTGVRKPNDPADPDYVQPMMDFDICPLPYVWEPIDPYCEATSFYCAPGYVMNADSTSCIKATDTMATPPATPYKSVAVSNTAFQNNYALIYRINSYTPTGGGSPYYFGYNNPFWANPTAVSTEGAMNRCGLWVDLNNDGAADAILNKWLGFTATLEMPADKIVLVAVSATTSGRIILTNQAGSNRTIVSFSNTTLYREWRLFEVPLKAGRNIIQMEGQAGVNNLLCFGAEIYSNTWDELYWEDSRIPTVLWSTADMRGQYFHTGEGGYSCPAGYALDYNNGSSVCRQVLVDTVKQHNSGKLAYRRRKRLLRGVADGYIEQNIEGTGTGPYFPPVPDTTTCPIN